MSEANDANHFKLGLQRDRETALVRVMNDLLVSADPGASTILVSLVRCRIWQSVPLHSAR